MAFCLRFLFVSFSISTAFAINCDVPLSKAGMKPEDEAILRAENHRTNYLNHEDWRAMDQRLARYKAVEGLPETVRDQGSLDAFVRETLAARRTVDGQNVSLPRFGGVSGHNGIGFPVYRFIKDADDALAFARSLEAKGVAPGDVYGKTNKVLDRNKPLFSPGRVYEDIKAQDFDQILGENNRGLNETTTRFTLSELRASSLKEDSSPHDVRGAANLLEYYAARLHRDWLNRPENDWVRNDPSNPMNGDFHRDLVAVSQGNLREKDLTPVVNAMRTLMETHFKDQPDIMRTYDAAVKEILARYRLEARLAARNESRRVQGLPPIDEYIPGSQTGFREGSYAYVRGAQGQTTRIRIEGVRPGYPYGEDRYNDHLRFIPVDDLGNPVPNAQPRELLDYELNFVVPPWLSDSN
jgi:hypothetical protein